MTSESRTTGSELQASAAGPNPSASDLVRGISPVLEVPFTDGGDVDLDGFERVVQYVLATGVSSVMFPGFASEFHKLSELERDTLTEILLRHTRDRPDVCAIVAVQDHATTLAVARARSVIAAGADMINLLPPHFLSPSRRALIEHVSAVLEAVAPAGVIMQYAPKETGTSLDAATLRMIAAESTNLRMVKVESSPPGSLIHELAAGTPSLLAVEGYAGVQLPDAFRRGAVGSQPGCSFIEIYQEIWRRFADGDLAGGDALHRRLLPYISYWMLDTELIIAAEKEISRRRGLFASARCREPAHRLDAEELSMIDRFMAEFTDFISIGV
ncbi:dihydrodipicolinate synthase family protein [Nakamurella lactea]|uniref:dihydrodipicolinate synthase family protein n=1 Tax=Nakamurella lactea TaxID=459515 RepID=UPI0009FD9B61|nr:dihydrodipicolinate synthase family protein [Nakamurella lactea]